MIPPFFFCVSAGFKAYDHPYFSLIGNVGFMGQDWTHNILGVEGTFDLKKHILEHPSKTHQTPSKNPIFE